MMLLRRAVLPVPSGPPFVTLEPSSTSAREGDTINITCTVLGEPEVDVSFSWSHPGQVREGQGKVQIFINNQHYITQANFSNSKLGLVTIITIKKCQCDLGELCCVQERRPVDIQTSRRLINQGMGHTTRISHSVITIHDLESSDLGRYICRAKNLHGVTAVSTRISST